MSDKVKVPCEVFTRCCGYFRPLSQMNNGIKAQVADRKMLKFELKDAKQD